jgi:hypothetical protein
MTVTNRSEHGDAETRVKKVKPKLTVDVQDSIQNKNEGPSVRTQTQTKPNNETPIWRRARSKIYPWQSPGRIFLIPTKMLG